VDDVVVKTRNSNALIADLEETFASLREYQWKLNPNECIFGVPSGKLLDFIISHCGIEANPEKISAITNMKAPTCIKDVQKLTGCMAALNRFISRLGQRGLPFFKLLKTPREVHVDPKGRSSLGSTQRLPVQATSPHGSSHIGAVIALPRCDYSCGQYCHHR
jgi:hypothetical protein